MRQVGVLFTVLIFLSACAPPPSSSPETTTKPQAAKPLPSAIAIINPRKSDIVFAQTALKNLGYRIGFVDGIWGPRSAKAIRNFESRNNLKTAQGRLSELSISKLGEATGLNRDDFSQIQAEENYTKIVTKLKSAQPLSSGPQLVIVDKSYKVLGKPNPYSSHVGDIASGTGVYVVAQLEDNWFEIELTDRVRGYIKDR